MAQSIKPGPKNLVMPVNRTLVSFDADARRLGPTSRPSLISPISMSFFDALALPRIVKDADGQCRADFDDMVGFLAEKWETNADCTEWIVSMRPGAISHFGNELTAGDVKWSWDRTYALRGVGLWRNRNVMGMPSSDGVRVLDDRTVSFTLPTQSPNFSKYWAFATGCIFDSREARRHASGDDPWATEFLAGTTCGFGPFRLERFDGSELVGVANEGYWGGRPGIDRIAYVRVDARAEAMAEFEQGNLNFIAGLLPAEYRRLAAMPGVASAVAKTNQAQIDFDWKNPPLDDVRVRQAILIALPYSRIIQEAYQGFARPSHGPFFDISPEYDPSYWPYGFDLDRARSLVQEAGAGNATLDLAVGQEQESTAVSTLVVEALAAIGLRVRRIPKESVPPGELAQMWLVPETSHGIIDPQYNLAHEYDPPRGHHGGRFIRDKDLSERLRAIAGLPDAAAKADAYRRLARDIVDLAPKAFLANLTFQLCYRDDIDPWVASGRFAGYNHLLWAVGRSLLPGQEH